MKATKSNKRLKVRQEHFNKVFGSTKNGEYTMPGSGSKLLTKLIPNEQKQKTRKREAQKKLSDTQYMKTTSHVEMRRLHLAAVLRG